MKIFPKMLISFVLLMVFVFCYSGQAQIFLTATDLLNFIETTEYKEADDTTNSITMNVGNAGANQSWNFSNVVMQQNLEEWNFLDPVNTPFASDFPNANMAIKIIEQAYPDTFYIFFRVDDNIFIEQGSAAIYQGISSVVYDSSSALPLPLTMGSQWTELDTFQAGSPGFLFETIEIVNGEVDAWGTVTVPNHTLSCLRLRENITEIDNEYYNNVLISSDTNRYINYEWLGKEILLIAQAESQDNVTNPNFTQAAYFVRDVTAITPIMNNVIHTTGFLLFPNYPNPFNPTTTISFQLSTTCFVTLKVYDLVGRKIATLVHERKTAGEHLVQWNAANYASGIYYYKLQAGEYQELKKMILMK